MRISDWSSDVCSSDLRYRSFLVARAISGRAARRVVTTDIYASADADCPGKRRSVKPGVPCREVMARRQQHIGSTRRLPQDFAAQGIIGLLVNVAAGGQVAPISLDLIIAISGGVRSEEHTAE